MSTSKLQREVGSLLNKSFPYLTILENTRPEWLISPNFTRMELDFYIPELQIAFEIQGLQHYIFVPHFQKTYSDFEKRLLYDEEKRTLCKGAGIKLIEIASSFDAIIEIGKLSNISIPENTALLEKHKQSIINVAIENDKKIERYERMVSSGELVKKTSDRKKISVSDVRGLAKWRKRCVYLIKKGRGNGAECPVSFISEECRVIIQARLSNSKTEDDIRQAFSIYLD